jgi:hypothetical protein
MTMTLNHRVPTGLTEFLLVGCGIQGLIGPLTAGLLLDKFGGTDAGAAPYKPTMVSVSSTFSLVVIHNHHLCPSRLNSALTTRLAVRGRWKYGSGYVVGVVCSSEL